MIYDERPWLKSYDAGVSPEIRLANRSMLDYYDECRKRFGARPALHFLGMTLTFEELNELSDRFARALADNGLGPGDVAAVSLANTPQYLIAGIGALKAGCALSGLSPLFTPDEMKYQLNDNKAKALVVLDVLFEQRFAQIADQTPELKLVVTTNIADYLPKMKQVLGKLLKKIPSGRTTPLPGKSVVGFKELLAHSDPEPPLVSIGPEDVCFIQYTGGTTGLPKGAVLTHGNIMANLEQYREWTKEPMGEINVVSGFPMFHLAGLGVAMICASQGHTQALIPDPRNTKHIIGEIRKYRPSLMCHVPSLAFMLLADPEFQKQDYSPLKTWLSGAAPFSEDGIRTLERVIGSNKVTEVWGMTETSPLITVNPVINPKKIGSVGLPLPSTLLRVVDLETGEAGVPIGQEGELICSGPQVMQGYLNKPDETANALREHDGRIWMHTGDVGRMDEDGFVYVVDRAKDMISVGGYKVFSAEVENKLYEHPSIEFCAIIGQPNPDRPEMEMVKLVVQKSQAYQNRPDEETKAELIAFCREKLSPYKVPKTVEFVEAIPLTAVGKVDKKALR